MSTFNKPCRTDEELEGEQVERLRKQKYDKRSLSLKLADDIYKNVIDEIEKGGKIKWTKKEMIKTARGEGKFSLAEEISWNKYCDIAIGKIRRRYWNVKNPVEQKMFNFVRYKQQYWLIPIDDALRSNVVFGEYQMKMRAAQKKDKQLKESVYGKMLELNEVERSKLIKELREEEVE